MSEDSLDEINQIMNDIEKLQAHVASTQAPQPAPEPTTELNEFQASGGGDGGSMEETLGDLGEEQPGTGGLLSVSNPQPESSTPVVTQAAISTVVTPAEPVAPVVPISNRSVEKTQMSHSSGSGGPGVLSMTLKGDMELELNYESGEQSVSLKFDDGTFVVQLADGTEFRVPMKKAASGSRRTA